MPPILTKLDDKTLQRETNVIETVALSVLEKEMADIDKHLWRNDNQKVLLLTQKAEKQRELDTVKE